MTRPTFKIAFCITGDMSNRSPDWWTPSFKTSFGYARLEIDYFVVAVQDSSDGIDRVFDELSPKGFLHLSRDGSPARTIVAANDQRRVDYWSKAPPDRPVTLGVADELQAIMRASLLKRDAEIDGRFEYDICVHVNPNNPVAVPDKLTFPKENFVSVFEAGFNHDFLGWKMSPDFFFARSMEFDILCRAFDFAHVLKPVAFNHRADADLGNILYFFTKVMHLDINAVTKS